MSAALRSPAHTRDTPPIDPQGMRRVCGLFATGVTVITTALDGRAEGTTVNSFTSVSLEPPLVLFCLHKQSRLHQALNASGGFTVNFLSGQQEKLARAFAGRRPDGFGDVPHHFGDNGLPVLTEALAHLTCKTADVHEGGDHDIVVGEVIAMGTPDLGQDPLLFFDGTLGPLESVDGRFGQAGPKDPAARPARAG